MNKEKNHLPLVGVGPAIVFGQFGFTGTGIALTYIFDISFARVNILKIPFFIIGIMLIFLGAYLDLSAKLKSKMFQKVKENRLITDGVYAYTRNPVYSGALLVCVGAVFIANNLLLFIVPIICWAYMTIFLIFTEEKWLTDLYGQEYIDYCKRVNRCIPWFK